MFQKPVKPIKCHSYISSTQLYQNMKGIILLGLLCTLAVQQTVLISSSDTNPAIAVTPGTLSLSTFHENSVAYQNYIGFGAKWIYKGSSSSWPNGDTASFTIQFYADCQSAGTLVACADNSFTAIMNGGTPVAGSNFPTKSFIPIDIKCGLNTLVIRVTNKDANSPAGLIFAVTQDQGGCYSCKGSPLAYYNRDTCKCECTEACKCSPVKPFVWQGYPICGCTCAVAKKCEDYQYWDDKTCTCKCKKVYCPANQIQDSKTCKCKGKCLPFVACTPPFQWDFDLCTCGIGATILSGLPGI